MTIPSVVQITPLTNGTLVNHPASDYEIVIDNNGPLYRLIHKETGESILELTREQYWYFYSIVQHAVPYPVTQLSPIDDVSRKSGEQSCL